MLLLLLLLLLPLLLPLLLLLLEVGKYDLESTMVWVRKEKRNFAKVEKSLRNDPTRFENEV